MIKGASMFSGGGIAETYFDKAGINIVVANELIPKRGKFYQDMYPNSKMIVGDITDNKIKKEFMDSITDDIKFLIATPPCQGISTLGLNKHLDQMQTDSRNYLVFHVFDVIDNFDFDYIMIENVSRILSLYFPYNDTFLSLEEILNNDILVMIFLQILSLVNLQLLLLVLFLFEFLAMAMIYLFYTF